MNSQILISVIGLGYVGLPLAIELAKVFSVVGYDINEEKINFYRKGIDLTNEVGHEVLKNSTIRFSNDEQDLSVCNFHIIAVPTPINSDKTPNLTPIINACKMVGRYLTKNSIVVFESTVYPGTTEEICIPVLEQVSGLTLGRDFKVGYSPERINPGDKINTLRNIIKIVSATDKECLDIVSFVYNSIIDAGVYPVSSIKIAEAAKIIENTQRDINIAFMNELSMVFHKMNIDTDEVLHAASTKWNFINFKPGLVGGHCIGVDPYYFIYKAEQLGYHSQIIAAGRKINNEMGKFVAQSIVKEMTKRGILNNKCRIGILGFTFKENCSDCRNTKVIDIVKELEDYNFEVLIHDPLAKQDEVYYEYNIELVEKEAFVNLDTVVIAVAHDIFKDYYSYEIIRKMLKNKSSIIFDLKSIYNKQELAELDIMSWSL
nr:nucleotide sugar dehydrogenase [Lysinibacillus timonensis]